MEQPNEHASPTPHWHQGPTSPGMYLRSNPPISHLTRQDIVEVDGALKTSHGWGAGRELVPVAELSDRFWWYGPIPQPPWKKEAAQGKKALTYVG